MELFNRKKSRASANGDGKVVVDAVKHHPNTPASAFNDGANKFAEIYGSSLVSSTRMFVISTVCLLLAILAVGAVMALTPLKEVRPWVVEVNTTTGIVNKPIEIEKITPNLAVIKSELARWAEAVYTIDPLRTSDLFKQANSRSRDKAVVQFMEFRAREKTFERMQREPGLVREVKVTSVDASQAGIAFVFLSTTERLGRETPTEGRLKKYRLTLHYQLDPATQQADLLINPLGIYVTFFNEAEEKAN